MDELQKARADWIAAQERILQLEKENGQLLQDKYALQMKLYVAEAQAASLEAMHEGFLKGLLGVRS